jgi:hypothetical protein
MAVRMNAVIQVRDDQFLTMNVPGSRQQVEQRHRIRTSRYGNECRAGVEMQRGEMSPEQLEQGHRRSLTG